MSIACIAPLLQLYHSDFLGCNLNLELDLYLLPSCQYAPEHRTPGVIFLALFKSWKWKTIVVIQLMQIKKG